jgi:nitroreductase
MLAPLDLIQETSMDVADAVAKRISVRAFKPDPVPAKTVRAILESAQRAPSGGNLQPWRVHAIAGAPLEALKKAAVEKMAHGGEAPEYDVYPPNLWDPLRTRRYECGEDLYATIAIPREDKPARLRQLAKNAEFFGAPVGLFFTLDRKVGPPQWADVGMFMQTVMLLAVEHGLGTCAQEFWARLPQTVGGALNLPEGEMLFSGMALGVIDNAHPINTLRTRREPFEAFATMQGF